MTLSTGEYCILYKWDSARQVPYGHESLLDYMYIFFSIKGIQTQF